ncbi:MAG TPA: hypothetical protein PLE74_06345 [Candidatus Cloacimonadota bacterium]|nr:hypothetical protein [Candidatus Cloacimonadota bacterium]HPT71883.1 hypothetical protein [Candidatus Cloacimonadota bacterium]
MKNYIILISILVFVFTSAVAWAHPAKRIDLTFNKNTKVLAAKVVHDVKDNVKHYTKNIQITVNKRDVLTHDLTMQDNLQGGMYMYKLNDVKPGDTISLTTTCNFVGTKTASITVK